MSQSSYHKTYKVRWADMDPNRHLRHSVYLDYAAQTRVALFSDYGLPIAEIARFGLGPILFREEIKYLREVNAMEKVKILCQLRWMHKDGSRWSFFHRMFKNSGTPVAELTVDGSTLEGFLLFNESIDSNPLVVGFEGDEVRYVLIPGSEPTGGLQAGLQAEVDLTSYEAVAGHYGIPDEGEGVVRL